MDKKITAVTSEEMRSAARAAKGQLTKIQTEIGYLLAGLDGVIRDDANFSTASALKRLIDDADMALGLLRDLAKIHKARLATKVKEI